MRQAYSRGRTTRLQGLTLTDVLPHYIIHVGVDREGHRVQHGGDRDDRGAERESGGFHAAAVHAADARSHRTRTKLPLHSIARACRHEDLARSRDRLTKGLESIGFPVLRSQGTYFLTVDLSPLGLNETDEAFCKRIVTDYKVAAIPVSAFYEKDPVTTVVRFCFAKKDTTLDTALERLSDAVHRRK